MKLLAFFVFFCIAYALNLQEINKQAYERIEYMQKIEDFPDNLKPEVIRLWITQDKLPEGELYINARKLSPKDMERFFEEANLEGITGRVSFGITLKRTNMRMYPSDDTIHKGNPKIDYNQYTLLEPFIPLAVLHSSKSGKWLYVHAPFMRGWVKREDVRFVNREELLRLKGLPFLVVVKGRKSVGGVVFGLGSRVPFLERRGNQYLVLLPDGRRVWTEAEGLHEGYLPFEEEKAKAILESLLGEPYDWGGKEGRWDCSSLVQSLFAVFGANLPRNSYQQAKIGRQV
ncbi:MAG: glycoside hydrolase, partial [Aquificota bacterium]